MSAIFGPVVKVSTGPVRTMDYTAALDAITAAPLRATSAFAEMRYGAKFVHFRAATKRCVDARTAATIPDDVKAQAAMYAPRLVATMRESVSRMARHQTAGSLDTSKLVRLARPTSAAQFERDAATAFRARTVVPRIAPLKIAIVADFNWEIRKEDPTYAPRVGTLAFILSDAAATAGLQCAAYAVRGRLSDREHVALPWDIGAASLLSVIANYGQRIRPVDFEAHTNHQVYVDAFRHAGFTIHNGHGSTSFDGTGGPSYAREHDGATFVVGIGEFRDAAKCDVLISPGASLADAVAAIHGALQRRNRAAA